MELPSSTDSTADSWGQRILQGSLLVSIVRRAPETRLGRTLQTASRTISTLVGGSFLYRWLTKEPDPEVIVLDLRETWTVAPVISMVNRLIEWVLPYWQTAALKQLLGRVGELGTQAADTRYGQVIVSVLEPPEPPDERSNTLKKDRAEIDKPKDRTASSGESKRQ